MSAVLGDTHYNDPELRQMCDSQGRFLVATKRGKYPLPTMAWVRRIFHQLHSGY